MQAIKCRALAGSGDLLCPLLPAAHPVEPAGAGAGSKSEVCRAVCITDASLQVRAPARLAPPSWYPLVNQPKSVAVQVLLKA